MKFLRELFSVLDRKEKIHFLSLQLLIIFTVFFEVTGVTLILPFTSMIGDPSILDRENMLSAAYNILGFASHNEFIIFSGVLILVFLFLGAIIGILTSYRVAIFASSIGVNMGSKLYQYYLGREWTFHIETNSSELIKKISTECQRLIEYVLIPLMQLNSRILLAFTILVLLLVINPQVALSGFAVFSIFYLILFSIVRKIVSRNGQVVSDKFSERYKVMIEGFGGIKELLILGRADFFYRQFEEAGSELAKNIGTNQALVNSPRYLVEFLAFSSVIVLILYLSALYSNELSQMLPIISIYAVSALKLLPALQGVYGGFTSISANMAAFNAVKDDLLSAAQIASLEANSSEEVLKLNSSIDLKNVTYSYPNQNELALENLTVSLPANKLIGIVGPTGSGKSTIVDLILGLLQPQSGEIRVDGKSLTPMNLRSWQNNIGYVPQSSYLSDTSFAENIAFGIKMNLIDMSLVKASSEIAMIDEYILGLKDQYFSIVGEQGVQMSGGQKQRVSIARALYHQPDFLVLDEATSALDGITEKKLMEAIIELSSEKTILMIAHKLNTVKNCDIILFIDNGKLNDIGTFDGMLASNPDFHNFVNAVWKS